MAIYHFPCSLAPSENGEMALENPSNERIKKDTVAETILKVAETIPNRRQ